MLLTACDASQSNASGSPVLFLSGSWHPKLLAGCTERSELHQASRPYWVPIIMSIGNLTCSPYTISNGEQLVLSATVELMANSK